MSFLAVDAYATPRLIHVSRFTSTPGAGREKKDQKNPGRFKSGAQKLGMWNRKCFGAEKATDGLEV